MIDPYFIPYILIAGGVLFIFIFFHPFYHIFGLRCAQALFLHLLKHAALYFTDPDPEYLTGPELQLFYTLCISEPHRQHFGSTAVDTQPPCQEGIARHRADDSVYHAGDSAPYPRYPHGHGAIVDSVSRHGF